MAKKKTIAKKELEKIVFKDVAKAIDKRVSGKTFRRNTGVHSSAKLLDIFFVAQGTYEIFKTNEQPTAGIPMVALVDKYGKVTYFLLEVLGDFWNVNKK